MTRAASARGTAARALLVSSGLVFGLVIGEVALRLLDLPRNGPFLQEFRGKQFKLMCYDSNPSGALDLDLGDPALRTRLSERL